MAKLSWEGLFGKPESYPKPSAPISYSNPAYNQGGQFGLWPGGFDIGTTFNPSTGRGETNTVVKDGGSDFLNVLSAFGKAAFASIGGRDDGQPQYQPASYTRTGGGIETSTVVLIGLVGAGIYFATKG